MTLYHASSRVSMAAVIIIMHGCYTVQVFCNITAFGFLHVSRHLYNTVSNPNVYQQRIENKSLKSLSFENK